MKGKILFENDGGNVTAVAGETVLVSKGTRFRPSFPEDTEYIPVCVPAFKQSLCIREDESNDAATETADMVGSCTNNNTEGPPDVIYHMTTKAEWETALAQNHAYFPKTFEVDGHYTHATAVPSRLIETANHFYQDVVGDWVCLQFRRSVLRSRFGIVVKDEEAMPVGEKKVSENWESGMEDWVCPHVYGGIPLACVEKVYAMVRDGPKYVRIEGLV